MNLSATAQVRQKQALDHYKRLAERQGKALAQIKAKLAQDARPRRRKGPKTARPVRPNQGVEAAYRKALDGLIQEMQASVLYWLKASFRANEPEIVGLAQDGMIELSGEPSALRTITEASGVSESPNSTMASDALPANELRRTIRQLARRWQRRFNLTSPKLARWFAQKVHKRSMADLMKVLKEGGWTVEHQTTFPQQDILQATIQQNVSLIRSIPSQYFTQIEGMVMRSVQTGRDLQQLTNDLQRQFRITRKRAILIARDQNNKCTSALVRARQIELGIKSAIWVHSGAGKEPRPTHVANNGKPFDVVRGWYDPHERKWIHPGELINCFPALTDIQCADGVEKAYRRWYSGELTELVTNSGITLRATPNHPVFTPKGLLALNLLKEGDYIYKVSDSVLLSVISKKDKYRSVPAIADIFNALEKLGGKRVAEISTGYQFHGDGMRSEERDIDIVYSKRPLGFGFELTKSRSKLLFRMTNYSRLCFRAFNKLAMGTFLTAYSGVRRFGKGLSLLWGKPFPILSQIGSGIGDVTISKHSRALLFGCVGPISFLSSAIPLFSKRGVSSLRESSDFNSMFPENIFDPGIGTIKLSSTIPEAFAGIVELDKVRFINRLHWSGHVYNLQTLSGSYIAQKIVVGNCRCTSRSIIPGFE